MRDVYIPDLTERFPEGFDGVDMTDSYFPSERYADDGYFWEAMDREFFKDDTENEIALAYNVAFAETMDGYGMI